MKGKFENIPEEDNQEKYRTLDDFRGENTLEIIEKEVEILELDYAAGSIGVGFSETKKVTKIKLTPENMEHRVDQRHLAIYYGSDRYEFTELTDWEYLKNGDGEILILLREPIDARYIKVKTYLDDRDEKLNPVNNAEFRNKVKDIIKVYYYVTERTEIYEYDAIGNRLEENISDWRSVNRNYSYYPNSNRLKSNEKYTFYYDDNGNMISKVSAEDEWEYEYDLLDRMINVTRNDTSVAVYTYNADGLRLKKENSEKDIYYVYNQGDQIIYEQENDTNYEYIYVAGKHFARVDTNRVTDESRTYFYNTDHLGSTVLVTDEAGKTAWTAEYTPFGSISMAEGLLGKAVKFTGKDLDEDTGLYYYNARWYDQELGRFISEDTYQGELETPQTFNLYIYVLQNPLKYIDPSGYNPVLLEPFDEVSKADLYMDRNLSFNSEDLITGQDVEFVQGILWNLGLMQTSELGYGTQTQSAIMSFQEKVDLEIDGAVDQTTLKALLGAMYYVEGLDYKNLVGSGIAYLQQGQNHLKTMLILLFL